MLRLEFYKRQLQKSDPISWVWLLSIFSIIVTLVYLVITFLIFCDKTPNRNNLKESFISSHDLRGFSTVLLGNEQQNSSLNGGSSMWQMFRGFTHYSIQETENEPGISKDHRSMKPAPDKHFVQLGSMSQSSHKP